jgi:hypothetical protein
MKLMDDNKTQIISEYNNGTSVAKLAKIYSVNQWSIKNLLVKNGVAIRSFNDLKIKFDESFFFAQTPETYYFWGFMLGDGCLIQHKQGHRYITITVKENDESILRQFCEWLHLEPARIKHGTNNYGTKYSRLEVYGNFFKKDFSQFGLVPRKTYNPVIPNIPEEYVRPFLLGLIDADGSVAWHKAMTSNKFPDRKQQYEHSIQLIGHPLIMDWATQQMEEIGYSGNINEQIVKGKWKRVRTQRKEDILQLASCLQLDQYHHLCLSRKWQSLYEAIVQ